MPKTATGVTATGLTLRADVHTSVAGPVTYWFEYGKTDSYASATPKRTIASEANESHPVSEPLTGLDPDTSYRFRVCASDLEEDPPRVNCSGAASFGTVGDSVSGSGDAFFGEPGAPNERYVLTAEFRDIRSGPKGENPAGVLRFYPQTGGIFDYDVTCLRMAGTRFTIGSRRVGAPDEEPTFRFFELINGTFGTQGVDGRDPADCPHPSTGLPGDLRFEPLEGFSIRDAP